MDRIFHRLNLFLISGPVESSLSNRNIIQSERSTVQSPRVSLVFICVHPIRNCIEFLSYLFPIRWRRQRRRSHDRTLDFRSDDHLFLLRPDFNVVVSKILIWWWPPSAKYSLVYRTLRSFSFGIVAERTYNCHFLTVTVATRTWFPL